MNNKMEPDEMKTIKINSLKVLQSYGPKVLQSYSPKVLLSYSLTVLSFFSVSLQLAGQGKNEEVTIIAPYIPSIGDAVKIPFRPEINPAPEEVPDFSYDYVTKKVETKMELDPIEPMKYSVDKKEQFYRNYAKVGFGNYTTPYLDFMASSLQSENYLIGARVRHHSSQGKIKGYPPSAFSHNLVALYGRYFSKTHTLSADLGYNRDVVHHYGFMPDSFPDDTYTKDDLKQRFQHLYGTIGVSSNYKENDKLNHSFIFDFHYFTDLYETREAQVAFDIGLDKAFEGIGRDYNHSFALDMGLDYVSYQDTITSSNPLYFQIRPVYRFSFAQYRFEAGLDINMASENTPEESTFGIDVFPILKAEVIIVEEKVKAYAEISGNRTINTYRSLTGMNPFMISTPVVKYTDEQIKIGGGITGNAGGMNFLAEASYSHIKDMPLFVTDTSVLFHNQFDVVYDNIDLLKVKASLGYVKINELSARLLATYYHYIPKEETKAWHMPNFEIGLEASYTFLEKYTVRGSALALGSKYAQTYESGEEKAQKIKGAFDLGFGCEYQVNRMLAVFVDGNNLLNQHYQRWYEYPVQGILVMAGVKLSF
jgi:hypothetical protein